MSLPNFRAQSILCESFQLAASCDRRMRDSQPTKSQRQRCGHPRFGILLLSIVFLKLWCEDGEWSRCAVVAVKPTTLRNAVQPLPATTLQPRPGSTWLLSIFTVDLIPFMSHSPSSSGFYRLTCRPLKFVILFSRSFVLSLRLSHPLGVNPLCLSRCPPLECKDAAKHWRQPVSGLVDPGLSIGRSCSWRLSRAWRRRVAV